MLEFVCSWWKIQQQNSPSYTFSELVVMIWLKSHSKCKWRKCCHSQFHYHHALTETATFWKGRKFVKYLLISYSNFAHLNSKGLSQGGTASWTSLYIVLDACGFIFFYASHVHMPTGTQTQAALSPGAKDCLMMVRIRCLH